jgi:hypothetical protein
VTGGSLSGDNMERHFTLKINLDSGVGNEGDLQNLYEDGWNLGWASSQVVHKGFCYTFMSLFKDDDED